MLIKGSSLRASAYLGKDDQPHGSLECTADRIVFLDSRLRAPKTRLSRCSLVAAHDPRTVTPVAVLIFTSRTALFKPAPMPETEVPDREAVRTADVSRHLA